MLELTPQHFRETLRATVFDQHAEALTQALAGQPLKHGDWATWADAVCALPQTTESVSLDPIPTVKFGSSTDADALAQNLMRLHPWRKGPWRYDAVDIDCEWRSDWKWDRIIDANIDFTHSRVLDIGGGNGYFAIRAAAAGAAAVLNVDPTLLFYAQFLAFARPAKLRSVAMVPLRFEALPAIGAFDIVLSLGVLYHRRDPFEHLQAIKARLAPSGLLALETLVIDGDSNSVLVPKGRYARMRNVWFLPSVDALTVWLERAGYQDIQCHDITATRADEQRPTAWMQFDSLANALAPDDASRTVEGHPAPRRALFTAKAP